MRESSSRSPGLQVSSTESQRRSKFSLAPLALSTMYARRFPGAAESDLAPFFDSGREMGFDRFELSHILGHRAVERIVAAGHRIETVHHPCPASTQLRASDELTSADAAARGRAVKALVRSIETAARVGARHVVLHLGSLPDPDGEIHRLRFELTARFHAGGIAGVFAAHTRERLRARLSIDMPPALERACEALLKPIELARSLGVRIGIETGYHPHELPEPAGLKVLLSQTDADVVGAWLDTGHIAARAAIGVTDMGEWWAAVGDRWIGAHLHDIVGLRDHLAPGTGTLDFVSVLAELPADAALSCEVDWYLDPTEVEAGARHILEAMTNRTAQAHIS